MIIKYRRRHYYTCVGNHITAFIKGIFPFAHSLDIMCLHFAIDIDVTQVEIYLKMTLNFFFVLKMVDSCYLKKVKPL